MRLLIRILAAVVVVLLLLAAGAWWYLFGGVAVPSAKLVPSSTVFFASIPNAGELVAGYQTSQLKQVVESPNVQPLIDELKNRLGPKTLDLLTAFAPEMSGQSFFAITHLDPDHLGQAGIIAALKPKPGLDQFNVFVDKLKAAYPEIIAMGKTGNGQVAGVDYEWIQGPGAPDKICVAQLNGWIVTTWGEASLQDWIERWQKKSTTPSLDDNPDYQKAVSSVGKAPFLLTYLDDHAFLDLTQKLTSRLPNAALLTRATQKMSGATGFAIGTRFENGEIVDRFSLLMPEAARVAAGIPSSPCPFETLNFTAPTTLFYWGSSFDWKEFWKNLQADPQQAPYLGALQTWAQGENLDLQHNVIDPLGSEISLQLEWDADAPFPELGFFAKVDKPDDFKPTTTAIIDTVRKVFANSGLVNEFNAGGHNYATLKLVQPMPVPISPTMTEDGPYFGLFLNENQAARSFQRDESVGLQHNDDFKRQVGDKRTGASELVFINSPVLLDRSYRTALPYVSLASMFDPQLAALLKDRSLPPDLTWLAPIGTWSYVTTPDADGVKVFSTSGIGNQGIFILGGVMGAGFYTMEALQHRAPHPSTLPPDPTISPVQPPAGTLPANPPDATNAPPVVPVPDSNTTPPSNNAAPTPDSITPPTAPTPSTPPAPPAPDSNATPPSTNAPTTQ